MTRVVMFAETVTPCPAQALHYLDHLMAYSPCRTVLLEHNRASLRTIADCLKNITVYQLSLTLQTYAVHQFYPVF